MGDRRMSLPQDDDASTGRSRPVSRGRPPPGTDRRLNLLAEPGRLGVLGKEEEFAQALAALTGWAAAQG